MDGLVLALIALRTQFRKPATPVAKPDDFKPFNLQALEESIADRSAGHGARPRSVQPRPTTAGGIGEATV
jgi:hypothetical protein